MESRDCHKKRDMTAPLKALTQELKNFKIRFSYKIFYLIKNYQIFSLKYLSSIFSL